MSVEDTAIKLRPEWIAILLSFMTTVAVFAYGYSALNTTVESNNKTITEVKTEQKGIQALSNKIAILSTKADESSRAMEKLEKRVESIDGKLDDLRNMLTLRPHNGD